MKEPEDNEDIINDLNSVLEEQKGGGAPAESAQKPAESMKEEPKKEETVTAAKAK